ncbi:tRNA threonylcarbamoyladenosine biosynthesis protein TsaE [Dyadobacter jejuensis]|uniref:tRNA threonylcarbamoyladenosine biosynthesis protein TsaE n=1 Tax=Dyadobacter jejuensis TaxID=1082580 RepID=A0A316AP19_9BACT|nr:tRNA (adenosine(37)-N6)-threonylcarbamoyltransferase complex ATPase subunit type 1 TsaE [Dyadobacter jejuensis]PWJ59241.1 tRNA threonylcarbamoyladenosine biosynthesis protein TsaE [Dyadobacter jejuensis]
MNESSTIFRFKDLGELDGVAEQLLEWGKRTPIWLFEGPMGVGKTTLIQALCRKLGVSETVTSPTFALVNEYKGLETIYHFDFYRLEDEMEALDIGVEEYFDSGGYCFVEWPSKIESLWPQKYLMLELDLDQDRHRVLSVKVIAV